MSEITLQWISFSKIIFLAFYALCYAWGGYDFKWKRRFLGAALLTLGFIGYSLIQHTFSFWYLLCFPLTVGATSLGYGADITVEKVFKRTYCGIAYALCALPLAIINNQWILFATHMAFCIAISVILGVLNPTESREEETQIAVIIGFMPIFMV